MILIEEGTGEELLPAIRQSARAMVYLSVPWAATERASRVVFRNAVFQMKSKIESLGIRCFFLHMDLDPVSERWLRSLKAEPPLILGGNGEPLWLESGEVIAWLNILLRERDVIVRTDSLWESQSRPPH